MILLEHEYHGIELRTQLPEQHYNWLVENLGPPDGTRWYLAGPRLIYFANAKDHLLFLIRVS